MRWLFMERHPTPRRLQAIRARRSPSPGGEPSYRGLDATTELRSGLATASPERVRIGVGWPCFLPLRIRSRLTIRQYPLYHALVAAGRRRHRLGMEGNPGHGRLRASSTSMFPDA